MSADARVLGAALGRAQEKAKKATQRAEKAEARVAELGKRNDELALNAEQWAARVAVLERKAEQLAAVEKAAHNLLFGTYFDTSKADHNEPLVLALEEALEMHMPHGKQPSDSVSDPLCSWCDKQKATTTDAHGERVCAECYEGAPRPSEEIRPLPACTRCGAPAGVLCVAIGQVYAYVCPGRLRTSEASVVPPMNRCPSRHDAEGLGSVQCTLLSCHNGACSFPKLYVQGTDPAFESWVKNDRENDERRAASLRSNEAPAAEDGLTEEEQKNAQMYQTLALIHGFNEMATKAITLGEKAYYRLARDTYEKKFNELGGKIDRGVEQAPVLVIPGHVPEIRFDERDIELMRACVARHDGADLDKVAATLVIAMEEIRAIKQLCVMRSGAMTIGLRCSQAIEKLSGLQTDYPKASRECTHGPEHRAVLCRICDVGRAT